MCNCDQGTACSSPTAQKQPGAPAKAYPNSYGVHDKRCPTGVQFEPLVEEGYGTGLYPFPLAFTMVDKLQLPDLQAGEYSLSWRWDCEETPQGECCAAAQFFCWRLTVCCVSSVEFLR